MTRERILEDGQMISSVVGDLEAVACVGRHYEGLARVSTMLWSRESVKNTKFLVVTKQLDKRVCPSVGRSVGNGSAFRALGATYVVFTELFPLCCYLHRKYFNKRVQDKSFAFCLH